MKHLIHISILVLLVLSAKGFASDVEKDLESLGGSKDLIRKAKALDPKNRMQIVQKRAVDRTWRLELGVNYGMVAGGDPYTDTDQIGASLDIHITPHWSIGARYNNANNHLSSEGKRVFDGAQSANGNENYYEVPSVDYVKDEILGVINWYPMYGKVNLFDWSVAQFDIYLLAGGGQVNLKSGSSPTYTGGGGVGLWWSQHFSTRFEARYQTYEDQVPTGARQLDQTVLSMSLGFLL